MAKPQTLQFVPLGEPQAFIDAYVTMSAGTETLGELLAKAPAYAVATRLDDKLLGQPVSEMIILPVMLHDRSGEVVALNPGALPPAAPAAPAAPAPDPASQAAEASGDDAASRTRTSSGETTEPSAASGSRSPRPPTHPAQLREEQAVAIAYQSDVKKLATFLRSRLSLLVSCEKLVTPYLWKLIVEHTWLATNDGSQREQRLQAVLLELPDDSEAANPLTGGGNRLGKLRQIIKELKPEQILVIPNLDLLGGGGEKGLNRESRELTELIYSALDRLVLAFTDPSLPVPEVIAARFPVRAAVEGLPRTVAGGGEQRVAVGTALVTADEAAHFADYDPDELYKNIAGLNPLRLREAMAYAVQVARDAGHTPQRPAERQLLYRELRAFKAQSAEQFTIPSVTFDDIGGYEELKETLARTIGLISGAGSLPDEKLRHELTPRGFLFHGPPGTGKTLFAKAIANVLNASIRIVSGPEVTDMYVGESERKLRAIFAEARRNAPSVIVFDEFDAIAARRSGRDDGGSRAGNALVAQILTEMDGFRPEVPMLVIATTNRLGLIDEALLRPSRFQPVAINLPDPVARRHIARIHARHFHVPVDDELLEIIANATQGLNGDEIRAIFRDLCVSHYCQTPPLPIDAWQIGFQVGRVRTRLDAQQSHAEPSPPLREGERPRPGRGMVSLTGARPTTTPAAASSSPSATPVTQKAADSSGES